MLDNHVVTPIGLHPDRTVKENIVPHDATTHHLVFANKYPTCNLVALDDIRRNPIQIEQWTRCLVELIIFDPNCAAPAAVSTAVYVQQTLTPVTLLSVTAAARK